MRNPLARLASRDEAKPTLRERAAALKVSAARVIRRKPMVWPAPGSDEAKAMAAAARAEADRVDQAARLGYPDLKRTTLEWWTKDTLWQALEAGDMSAAQVAPLYQMAAERELRIEAMAVRAKVGALQALADAEGYPIPEHAKVDEAHDSLREFGLAQMVVAFFGEEPIDPLLNGDIALRDRARSILAVGADADAELIEIGRCWQQAVRTFEEADVAFAKVMDFEPKRPRELNVLSFDVMNDFPRPKTICNHFGWYEQEHVEELRAAPRVSVYLGGPREGYIREDGSFVKVNQHAQKRAETIIAAWDRYQAEIAAWEAEHNVAAVKAAALTANDVLEDMIRRARSFRASTMAGLLVKATIAAKLVGDEWADIEKEAPGRDIMDSESMLWNLLPDVLSVVGHPADVVREAGA
ncbi:hypothetical protein [Methylobacterium sp. A54F]